jgi:serine phosphatase RsbU (regulator of sigma subunit)
LDIEIRKAVRQDQTQADVGIDISLLAIGRQDEHNYIITFAGAKNSLHYILPETQELITIEGNKKSLGSIFHQEKLCNAQTLVLPAGSLLYVFTDGLYHQNDLQNKKFSKKRLLDLIEKNSVYPLSIQKTLFEETFETYKVGVFQRDDVLLMGFRL